MTLKEFYDSPFDATDLYKHLQEYASYCVDKGYIDDLKIVADFMQQVKMMAVLGFVKIERD